MPDGRTKHERDEQIHAAREARKQHRIQLYARRGVIGVGVVVGASCVAWLAREAGLFGHHSHNAPSLHPEAHEELHPHTLSPPIPHNKEHHVNLPHVKPSGQPLPLHAAGSIPLPDGHTIEAAHHSNSTRK
eukprot:TRINITY_DN289_c0_g5_i1.p1 TRINITY_DN289_c0_g5~~TRINITY_DN289_c0_g5_i1.p1  ORF type:complete len:131 (+),score=13.72 TRINITY_DN289_c0_g5_i1:56-448(+)